MADGRRGLPRRPCRCHPRHHGNATAPALGQGIPTLAWQRLRAWHRHVRPEQEVAQASQTRQVPRRRHVDSNRVCGDVDTSKEEPTV
eukprot:7168373-Pyramimonas_sp.AAC.1